LKKGGFTGKILLLKQGGSQMNPQEVFCPNLACHARGQKGKGNIGIQSQQDKRYICHECGQTFCARKGSIFYRLHTDAQTVLLVIALLVYGCPLQAIVKAFGFDERTVRNWWQRAGRHCEGVHAAQVGSRQWDLGQVQADEIKGKTQQGSFWMALALMVPTRLWLGGAVSARRDADLIQAVVDQVRRVALCRPLLLAVDGLPSYVAAFQHAFRSPMPRWGREKGRPRLIPWPDIQIVQVVKQRVEKHLSIERRIVQGTAYLVEHLLRHTQGGGVINTAFIERLNATFRQRLAPLARRTRALAQGGDTLSTGMWILGCVYNFCDYHQSLRLRLSVGEHGYHWVQRTPAIAAGLTDHCWSLEERFAFPLPIPRWSPPVQRGRPSQETHQLIERWCQ
jgi:transposase-like protein